MFKILMGISMCHGVHAINLPKQVKIIKHFTLITIPLVFKEFDLSISFSERNLIFQFLLDHFLCLPKVSFVRPIEKLTFKQDLREK